MGCCRRREVTDGVLPTSRGRRWGVRGYNWKRNPVGVLELTKYRWGSVVGFIQFAYHHVPTDVVGVDVDGSRVRTLGARDRQWPTSL